MGTHLKLGTTMPVSAVYLLDAKGKVIISRDYRGDVPLRCLERFITHVLETEETELKPIFEEEGVNYVYVKHNSLYGTLLFIALQTDQRH